MEIFYLIIGILITIVLIKTNNKIKSRKSKHDINETNNIERNNKETNYIDSYQPQYLMTINEKTQYRKLQNWANSHNLIVFTKVRLLDLITPKKDQENYKGALWKIQAKHVDFVICDQDIRVKCIVEINDGSHSRQDRSDRDNFVTEVLQACGYKVIMTYNINDQELDKICGYNQSTI